MPPRKCRLAVPVLLAALYAAAPTPLPAAPPVVTAVSPRGAERGKAIEIVLTGSVLTPQTRLVLPFKAAQAVVPDPKPTPAQARIRLTVDPSVPLGIYPAWAATDEGLSALFLFTVDAFPNVNEAEDNNTAEKAQKVTPPVIISGQCAGGDVDFYRFAAKKGQRFVIETESARLGSGVLPQLRVTDADGRFIASDDTQSLRGDCRVVFAAPADGDYLVEVSDSRYRGGNPPDYRLKIADYDVVEEVFPLGGRRGETAEFTLRGGMLERESRIRRPLAGLPVADTMPLALDGAVRPGMLSPEVTVGDLPERVWLNDGKDPKPLDVAPPILVNGRLGRKGAVDRFQFLVKAGQQYRFAVEAEALGSKLDGVLRVTDQAGKQLALVDDVALSPAPGQPPVNAADPSADVTVPADAKTLIVELRDRRDRGGVNFGYRLTIVPAVPDFTLQLAATEVNVPRGGSAAVVVGVTRRGYTGPVQLGIPNLPPGFSAQGGHVPAGAGSGVLTLSAAPGPSGGPAFLQVEGRATGNGRAVLRRAEHRFIANRELGTAGFQLRLTHFAVGLKGPEPFSLGGPPAVELVKGYPAAVPVTVTRTAKEAAVPVEVTARASTAPALLGQPAAPGPFAVKPATVPAGAAAGSVTLTPAFTSPDGVLDVILQGKARINNADRTVIGPAVPVAIVSPFAVELITPTLTFAPGQAVSLKGRLVRRPVFKEPVQLRMDGLPAGVTLAKPAPVVAAGATEFQIDLKADAKAAPSMTSLSLVFSATIASMAYAHPPVVVTAQVKPVTAPKR